MKVFKFGGASVKNAEAVRNVARILASFQGQSLAVVISAMGKTTNALEALVHAFRKGEPNWPDHLQPLHDFHQQILTELYGEPRAELKGLVARWGRELTENLEAAGSRDYDYCYDQVVSMGELLSTRIVAGWLAHEGLSAHWLDARELIQTDHTHRDARVDWEKTQAAVRRAAGGWLAAHPGGIALTQGFIGRADTTAVTTLGREGSDFSAAILAYCLEAESLTIWKDVPGMLNADPKWFNNTTQLDHISYKEAVELAYYGATVIHPKTIKPLQNRQIPLFVRSFVEPNATGTRIDHRTDSDSLVPSYIFKVNQTLISVSPRDYSFIVEENLSEIFAHFARHGLKMNTMQNSAIQFSVSVDHDEKRVPELIADLSQDYEVRYNTDLELLTIRHYDQPTVDFLVKHKVVLLTQKTRNTMRLLMRSAASESD